jgi:hypothetical protein
MSMARFVGLRGFLWCEDTHDNEKCPEGRNVSRNMVLPGCKKPGVGSLVMQHAVGIACSAAAFAFGFDMAGGAEIG